ncbi:hypothetical protein L1887_10374 [Cichorium endivia]|nr:hypothetical protein L1887_10374 [Cichorium endivia]
MESREMRLTVDPIARSNLVCGMCCPFSRFSRASFNFLEKNRKGFTSPRCSLSINRSWNSCFVTLNDIHVRGVGLAVLAIQGSINLTIWTTIVYCKEQMEVIIGFLLLYHVVEQFGIPHLFDLPIRPTLSATGDSAIPEVVADSEGEVASGDSTTKSPLRTPVSAKGTRIIGRSKVTKNNKSAPQTPVSNTGSPAPLTPVGSCRYNSSLGLLTKKFINLIKHAEDGILDLNNVADTWRGLDSSKPGELEDGMASLQAEVQKLSMKMQERMSDLSEDNSNQKQFFLFP